MAFGWRRLKKKHGHRLWLFMKMLANANEYQHDTNSLGSMSVPPSTLRVSVRIYFHTLRSVHCCLPFKWKKRLRICFRCVLQYCNKADGWCMLKLCKFFFYAPSSEALLMKIYGMLTEYCSLYTRRRRVRCKWEITLFVYRCRVVCYKPSESRWRFEIMSLQRDNDFY